MSFCFLCGSRLRECIPPGDDRLRLVCESCNYIHYENPRILVGVQLYCQEKLFWIRRATQPFKGLWAFPAGFLENGESLQEGAARELREETGIDVEPRLLVPFGFGSLVTMDQIYIGFRLNCRYEIQACLTNEVDDWGWFSEEEAPWGELAFPETAPASRQLYGFLRAGVFPLRVGEIHVDRSHTRYYMMDSDFPLEY